MKQAHTAADRAVGEVLRQQDDLVTRSQALSAGLTKQILRRRLTTGGPWQIVLPGVYLAHNGPLTLSQREIATVLYAGRGCVITGQAALRRHGVRMPPADVIDVLIPAAAQRQSAAFVRFHRTTRMPERPWVIAGIRYAPAARAVADAVCGQTDQTLVRALVAGAVQQGKCTVGQLAAELRVGPRQGSLPLREALAEVADGVASVAEGDMRMLIKASGLPQPMYNPSLYVGSVFLAKPDAWWPEAGLACEVDSREWHLLPREWERTMIRHDRMVAQGIMVLHFSPRRIRSDSAGVAGELRAAHRTGVSRPRLPIRAVPSTC